jgi:hypothetical protein
VVPFLTGRHTWAMEEARLLGGGGGGGGSKIIAKDEAAEAGAGGADGTGGGGGGAGLRSSMSAGKLARVKLLFTEIQRAVESKQLQPTLRTVYMRTAFQIGLSLPVVRFVTWTDWLLAFIIWCLHDCKITRLKVPNPSYRCRTTLPCVARWTPRWP